MKILSKLKINIELKFEFGVNFHVRKHIFNFFEIKFLLKK